MDDSSFFKFERKKLLILLYENQKKKEIFASLQKEDNEFLALNWDGKTIIH